MVGILSISLSSSMMLLMMLESRSIVMSVHVSLIGVHWLFVIVSVAVVFPWVDGACASAEVVFLSSPFVGSGVVLARTVMREAV